MNETGLRNMSESVPDEGKQDIADVIERNSMRLDYNENDLRYLFEMWDTFIASRRGEMQITCGHCRYYVVNRMKQFVSIWKQDGLVS